MRNIRNTYIEGLKSYAPDFFSGFSSVFKSRADQNLYDWFLQRDDWDGLRSDWYSVGNDLQVAMNKYNAK